MKVYAHNKLRTELEITSYIHDRTENNLFIVFEDSHIANYVLSEIHMCDLKQLWKVQVMSRTFSRQSKRITWNIVSRGWLSVGTSDTQWDKMMLCEMRVQESERAAEKEWIRENMINKVLKRSTWNKRARRRKQIDVISKWDKGEEINIFKKLFKWG